MKHFLFSFLFVVFHSICLAQSSVQEKIVQQIKPATCLWIGCSASHAVAGQCLGLSPDQLCVHTNLANLFEHTDPSAESSLRHAIETEKVSQIVVCGTYGCPAVRSAMLCEQPEGCWLHSVRALYIKNKNALDAIQDEAERVNRLVELNVCQQVQNIRSSLIVQEAFKRKHPLKIIGIAHNPTSAASRELVCVTTSD